MRCDTSQPFVNRFVGMLAMFLLMTVSAWSASYKVMFKFHESNANPSSGLVMDVQGNVYGTTYNGGGSGGGFKYDSGTVYEISPTTGYQELYKFAYKGAGGWHPQGNLVLDSAGNLYGTTLYGGSSDNGVVFELSPSLSGGLWTETVLHSFCSQANCADGANPGAGVIFDSAGNLYGTTTYGGSLCGAPGCGTVFELQPSQSGWTESTLYEFQGNGNDGMHPLSSLVFDSNENLYGTVQGPGPNGGGSVFELSSSASGWIFSVIYSFNGFNGSTDGVVPKAGLIFDTAGNLYGTTYSGGTNLYYGTVFELSPNLGGWIETILYNFGGAEDGANPESSLVFDSSGNLYGTTYAGGWPKGCENGCGTVFKLTPNGSNEWSETLYRFPVNNYSGTRPTAPVLLDAAGNVFGTTTMGGYRNGFGFLNDGVLFRIEQ